MLPTKFGRSRPNHVDVGRVSKNFGYAETPPLGDGEVGDP